MRILGLDPGTKTGWCVYDTDTRSAVAGGEFPEWRQDIDTGRVDAVVLERPRGQGPTFPQVVEAGIVFGYLLRWAEQKWSVVDWLYRLDVKRALRDATMGEITPHNDTTVWAALKMLHGGHECDRKASKKLGPAGPLGNISSHARAACAVAYAWWRLKEG